MRAKYTSRCTNCNSTIYPGDSVQKDLYTGKWEHLHCEESSSENEILYPEEMDYYHE